MYRAVCNVLRIYLRLFNSWEIEGRENIPQKGPVVLVANHKSLWDPIVLGCSINRDIHFMAKEELFKIPVFGKFIRLLKAFPIKRGRVDRNALKLAARYLEEGEILGLFPEGTRSKTPDLLPFQQGAALFALRSGAPIIPIGLIGTRSVFPFTFRGKIKVVIGKALIYSELYSQKIGDPELTRVTNEMAESIGEMLKGTVAKRAVF